MVNALRQNTLYFLILQLSHYSIEMSARILMVNFQRHTYCKIRLQSRRPSHFYLLFHIASSGRSYGNNLHCISYSMGIVLDSSCGVTYITKHCRVLLKTEYVWLFDNTGAGKVSSFTCTDIMKAHGAEGTSTVAELRFVPFATLLRRITAAYTAEIIELRFDRIAWY